MTLWVISDVNECLISPCKNGGTCVNLKGSYRCDCTQRYTGKHCGQGQLMCHLCKLKTHHVHRRLGSHISQTDANPGQKLLSHYKSFTMFTIKYLHVTYRIL